ncbi:Inosine-5'-monophosphate dehydrogenase [uncultured archaeon]|nr:Inosine-5'-monophosphate dehydrogenase [uncultured archaeon]
MRLASAVQVQASDPLSKALSLVEKHGVGVLVFDNKKYLGVIEERTLRSSAGDASTTRCKAAALRTPVLEPNISAIDACKAFFSGHFKTLPVMEGSRLSGVATRWEVMQAMREEGLLAGHTVGAHMASPILTIDANAPLAVADATMKQASVRRLAVLSNGHLVGLLSVYDLLKAKTGPKERRPQLKTNATGLHARVSSFMKERVETIEPSASLVEAVEKMLDKQVAALIVTEGLRPVGIITAKDIFESALYHHENASVQVSGLHDLERAAAQDVVEAGQSMLAKVGSSIGAESLAIHVKKTGKEYSVHAHVHGEVPLLASASDYDLVNAVSAVLDELRTQALKHKKTGMAGRKNKRF